MGLLLPFARAGGQYQANFSGRPTAAYGSNVTSGATAHTLGTKVELFAATDFETAWIEIILHTNFLAATNTNSLMNIYVGASTAEQLLIPNLLSGYAGDSLTSDYGVHYAFPLKIPAGSRITADCQSVRVSTVERIQMALFGDNGGAWTGTRVECLGAATGTSQGTAVTAGTTAEGTLTSIGTSTYEYGYVYPGMGGNGSTTVNKDNFELDIGLSGAAIPGLVDFMFTSSTSERINSKSVGRFCHIPAGTALYARLQGANATAQDVCIYGVF